MARSATHKSGPVEVDEMAHATDEEYDGEWEEAHAVGQAKGKGKGKSPVKSSDKSEKWQEESDYFLYKCHNCGEKGHNAGLQQREREPRDAERRASMVSRRGEVRTPMSASP